MNSLQVFCFESQEIRFVEGKPVANDVAMVLGFKNPADAVYRLVDKENKGICKIQTPGGIQSVTVLEEAGIYQLIFSSKLESAKKFQRWVFSDVLPSIRETGGYGLPRDYVEALKALLASEEEKILLKEQKALMASKIEQDAPLVSYAESVLPSETAIDFNSFAKMINTEHTRIGRTRLFRLMREMSVIMKNTTLPYQRWIDAGYFEVSQEVTEDGRLIPFALVTAKGQIWLKQKIDKHNQQQTQMTNLIVQSVLGLS